MSFLGALRETVDYTTLGAKAKAGAPIGAVQKPLQVPVQQLTIDEIKSKQGTFNLLFAEAVVVSVESPSSPDDEEAKIALSVVPGVYYRVANSPNGSGVFRQEANSKGVNNLELFLYQAASHM